MTNNNQIYLRFRANKFYFLIIIAIISSAAYSITLLNGFVMDDYFTVLKNNWIRKANNIPEIFTSNYWAYSGGHTSFYRPLIHIIFMTGYVLFGLNPQGFHLINLLFHAAVSILVFLISAKLFREIYPPVKDEILFYSFIASLLFALHPIHTEAVAWVSGITDVSYSFFYLLSFYLYIQWREKEMSGKIIYFCSVMSFFLSTLCKEPALTLPVVLVLYDSLFVKAKVWKYDSFRRYIPFLITAGIYLSMRIYALQGIAPVKKKLEFSAYYYLYNLPVFISSYIGKLLFPINLNVWHVFNPVNSFIDIRFLLSLAIISLICVIVIRSSKNKISFFGFIFFIIPLFPTLYAPALAQRVENVFTERYLYLPSLGFILVITGCILWLRENRPQRTNFVLLIVSIILVIYFQGTVRRAFVWKDSYTLWTDAAHKSPKSSNPHNALGDYFNEKGIIDKAIEEYKTAIKLEPEWANSYINLGISYNKKGLTDCAVEQFLIALKLNPEFPEPYNNLGIIYARRGKEKIAIDYFKKAIELNPYFEEAYRNLSIVYSADNNMEEAIKYLEIAIKLNPDNADSHNNLGVLYAESGFIEDAIGHFRTAIKLQPEDPFGYYNLSKAYEIKGLKVEAEEMRVKGKGLDRDMKSPSRQ